MKVQFVILMTTVITKTDKHKIKKTPKARWEKTAFCLRAHERAAASLILSHYNQRGTQALSPSALRGSINFLPLIPEVILRELQRRRQKLRPIIRGQVISRQVITSASGSGGAHRWLSLRLARPKCLLKSQPNCFLHLSLNAQELGVFNYACSGFPSSETPACTENPPPCRPI